MATEATYIDFIEAAAPSTPASGHRRVYAKTDGIYEKDDTGTEAGPIGTGGGGSGLYSAIVILADEKTSGTAGGTATSGSWEKRTLNTERADSGNHASLASSVITLDAGTWDVDGFAIAQYVDGHQARLQNTADTATLVTGTNAYASADETDLIGTLSVLKGSFTIASSKTIELQHRVSSTRATNGYGSPTSWGTEVYAVLELRKRA